MTEKSASADCLIELGMEELPPKAMLALSSALEQHIVDGLASHRLSHGEVRAFAAPRRLAVQLDSLALAQTDEAVVMRGPPTKVAFDAQGEPTRAALAFASKCGVDVADLQREKTDKGEWLVHDALEKGVASSELLPAILRHALDQLPIPRRMRWGSGPEGFVRPLHWLVMLHGEAVVPCTVFGIQANRASLGHRFHSDTPVVLDTPADYESALNAAFVIADFASRREAVVTAVTEAAAGAGGRVLQDDALIDEVTALCDWPVAVTGRFDERFLALPVEVLESTLKVHQRYFPVVDQEGDAINAFVTLANIDSTDPAAVRRGNERVVAPRLADAAFFWNNDTRTKLANRQGQLADVVYQKALGSLADKAARVSALAVTIAGELGIADDAVARAAALARCDLVTDMVGEFPDLQGVMGAYYAANDGEDVAVVDAIREQYYPRFAGDAIPATKAGQVLSCAERLDTLTGIFAIGKRPTGNRDPFGLRRAALGLLRIIIEGELELDLPALIGLALEQQPVAATDGHPELADDVYDYIIERLRHFYQQTLCAKRGDLFDAVAARQPRSMLDFDHRIRAVAAFVDLPEAESLAAANKRIANILRNAGIDANAALDPDALHEDAERALLSAWRSAHDDIVQPVAERDYASVLRRLAELRDPVDAFFDHVMVMAEDVDVRRNRMALLSEVRGLFLQVADISELSGAAR